MEKAKLYELMEQMENCLGTKQLLDELFNALSSQELEENLEYIDRMNDLGIFNNEEA